VSPTPPSPAAAYDGQYQGTVNATSVASSLTLDRCATDPRFVVSVRNNQFTYAQTFPGLVGTSPAFTPETASMTYDAIITPDGVIRGGTANMRGQISGRVTGTGMSGEIRGFLCTYTVFRP
jgi:hypothetical protein